MLGNSGGTIPNSPEGGEFKLKTVGSLFDNQHLHILPKLRALHDGLVQACTQTANGGGSAKALDYTLKRWVSLVRYAQTGHLPIGNNSVENIIRPITIDKESWPFTDSERTGQRAAAIQTSFCTLSSLAA